MSEATEKIYIPPFAGVRMIECRDHFQLVPVPAMRTIYGYGKIAASRAFTYTFDGKELPIWEHLGPDEEVWTVFQWYEFEDGHREEGNIEYLHPSCSEEEVKQSMERMQRFCNSTREEMLWLTQMYESKQEDFDFIDAHFPNYQSPPDPKATDEYDVYHARLKVLAGLSPKTVELLKIADETKEPAKRRFVERQAVQSYFAELAHYWTEDELLAWQRSNPVGTGWMCEFGEVMRNPRRKIDLINHELALNWLRRKYNQMTATQLSESIFKRILKFVAPWTIKKRRERLGLTTKRKPGSPQK